MGATLQHVWGECAMKEYDEDATPPGKWPELEPYEENGIIVRVFKAAWAEGIKVDHIVKSRRKGKRP